MADALAEFSNDLAQLADLDDAGLTDLETRLVDAFDAADQSNDETATTELADALDQVRAEIAKRSSAPPAEPVAAPAAAPAAPVAASAATPKKEGQPTVTATAVEVPAGHEPVVASALTTVVAGGDIPGVNVGSTFDSLDKFGKAMADRINQIRGVTRAATGSRDGEQVLIASIMQPAPVNRLLYAGDREGNIAKIEEVTNLDAILAAGGLCAPLETRYDLFDCGGVTDRPVKAALAGFQADRGGIRFFPGPSLGDVTGAIGFWTSTDDEDALDVDGPTKVCARIECPGEVTAEIQAVTMCLTFGVLQSRVFPELAVANTRLAQVAQARLADSALLAQIKAGSLKATETAKLSAVRDLLDSIGRAVIYYRDHYRLGENVPLRAIFPWFVKEILRGDIAMGDPGGSSNLRSTLSFSDAEIEGFFSDRKVNVTWTLDSSVPGTNSGGFYAPLTVTSGAITIPAWPTTVQWALYPEGSWLFLDGGQLDLGLVRDSSLIRKNDYMQFSETFEAATRIGCESWWITSSIGITGMYQGPRVDPAFQAATAANA